MTTVNSVEKTKFRKSIDTIALFGIILAGIAIPVTIATPELRCLFTLSNDCNLTDVAFIVKTEDNKPLEGAKIKYEFGNKTTVDTKTDKEGDAKLKISKNGDGKITIYKDDYRGITDTITSGLNSETPKIYTLIRESRSQLVDFTATVLSEEGELLGGVEVWFGGLSVEPTDINGRVNIKISSAERLSITLTKKGFYSYNEDIYLGNNSTYKAIFRLKKEVEQSPTVIPTNSPTVIPTNSPPTPPPKPITEDLSIDETNLVFVTFMNAWNSKDLNTQLSYLPNDFISESYDFPKQENSLYEKHDYEGYSQKKKEIIDSKYWIKVSASNSTFHQIDNKTALIRYYQEYKRGTGYESKGTNEFYFRKRGGKVEIHKEFFIRDSCKKC